MLKLSVIIPTRNRSALLAKCLDSLLSQTFAQDDFELIVADNGSTDDTGLVCESYRHKFAHFEYTRSERPGLHAVRHLGMKIASTDILAFIDDDARAFPSWLAGIAESFAGGDAVLVGGRCLPEFESAPPAWFDCLWRENEYGRYLGHYSLADFGGKARAISPQFIWGCNFSIRKAALAEAGGFHPDAMPPELIKFRGDGETAVADFIERRKYRTVYNPAASVYHFVAARRMTPEYLYERNFAQGISQSFADIRKSDGASLGKFNKYIAWLKRQLKFLLGAGKRRSGPEYAGEIEKIIEKGFRDGYEFHRGEIIADKNLLEWVLKKDYFD